MRDLAAKARLGTVTASEERETDAYERLGCLLDVIHSKARRALKPRGARLPDGVINAWWNSSSSARTIVASIAVCLNNSCRSLSRSTMSFLFNMALMIPTGTRENRVSPAVFI